MRDLFNCRAQPGPTCKQPHIFQKTEISRFRKTLKVSEHGWRVEPLVLCQRHLTVFSLQNDLPWQRNKCCRVVCVLEAKEFCLLDGKKLLL